MNNDVSKDLKKYVEEYRDFPQFLNIDYSSIEIIIDEDGDIYSPANMAFSQANADIPKAVYKWSNRGMYEIKEILEELSVL